MCEEYHADMDETEICSPLEASKYRSLIGSANWIIALERFDIAYATNLLARFVSNPTKKHMQAARQILRYLSATLDYGLAFHAGTGVINNVIDLQVFSDADWASDKLSRSSTSGYMILIGGDPVHWASQRQRSIAQSSTEAEYISINLAARESIWFRRFLSDIFTVANVTIDNQIAVSTPMIRVDNQAAAMWVTSKDVDHMKTKHVDLRYKYIRMLYFNGEVDIKWISTKHQLSDLLTKRINTIQFHHLRSKLIS